MVVGDSAGQLMPMFDRWSDSFQNRDVATSQFMHDLTRGLRCELQICRRLEPGQDAHFQLIKGLYDKPYFKPGEVNDPKLFQKALQSTLAELTPRLWQDGFVPDRVAVMSHQHRMLSLIHI